MCECWEDIEGYEGMYQVSNKGRVRSLEREIVINSKNQYGKYATTRKVEGKVLKPNLVQGYPYVNLYKEGDKELVKIHQLVIREFKDKPLKGYQVNHKNGDKEDNRLENLEYVTP